MTLLLLLQDGGRHTTPALARRLEVSERTVLRDLSELNAAGVPVFTVRGRNGGVELLPSGRGGKGAAIIPGATDPTPTPASDGGGLRRVRVLISPMALQHALVAGRPSGWRPRPVPDPHPDRPGWVEGTFRFTSYDAAASQLLALAPDVEVLLPPSLRARMAATARRVAAMHAPGKGPTGGAAAHRRGTAPAT